MLRHGGQEVLAEEGEFHVQLGQFILFHAHEQGEKWGDAVHFGEG